MLFDETHDLASGVMTDHVYDDTIRNYQFAESQGNHLIDHAWNHIVGTIDTRGDGDAFVVFNTLSWPRTDIAELTLAFSEDGVKGVHVVDDTGKEIPAQIVSAERARNGSIREAHVAMLARDIPPMGYRVFHATPVKDIDATKTAAAEDSVAMGNDAINVVVDGHTGAITSLKLKDGNWEAASAPANVIFRQEDHGDVWEPYHGLDGGSRCIVADARWCAQAEGDDLGEDSATFCRALSVKRRAQALERDGGRQAADLPLLRYCLEASLATIEVRFDEIIANFPVRPAPWLFLPHSAVQPAPPRSIRPRHQLLRRPPRQSKRGARPTCGRSL